MSTFEPTQFQDFETTEIPNNEQVAALSAFELVKNFSLFEGQLFKDVGLYATKHLLAWCHEVLAAYSLGCFEEGDSNHEYAKQQLLQDFKQFYNHGQHTGYVDKLDYDINWSIYILNKRGITGAFPSAIALLTTDNSEFFRKIINFRKQWSNSNFNTFQQPQQPTNLDDGKIGEDTGIAPAIIEDIPDTVEYLIGVRENALFLYRTYFNKLIKKPTYFRQKGKKLPRCGRRKEGGKCLIKNYPKMPHDRAHFQPATNTFQPSIFIDSNVAHEQFKLDFPEDCMEHGFMISCKGQTLFWNIHLKDFATKLYTQP